MSDCRLELDGEIVHSGGELLINTE
jgi:hypothetical protein